MVAYLAGVLQAPLTSFVIVVEICHTDIWFAVVMPHGTHPLRMTLYE